MTPEPTSSAVIAGVTAATVAITTAPGTSEYVLLLFGALIGALHSVGKVSTPTRMAAARYVALWVGTALVLTFAIAALLDGYLGVPARSWPGVVAFGITYLADQWPGWVRSMLKARLGVSRSTTDSTRGSL